MRHRSSPVIGCPRRCSWRRDSWGVRRFRGTTVWPTPCNGLLARVSRARQEKSCRSAARLAALRRLQGQLKTLAEDRFQTSLAGLLEGLGEPGSPAQRDLMLSWEDVLALRGLGFRIGAHTVSHPILSRLTLDRAREEILGSRRAIEAAVGYSPRAFAYPNGGAADYTSDVVDLVRAAGFTCAVTTKFGMNTDNTSPWELRRGQPWEEDLPRFALKLAWYGLTLR